MSKFISLLTFFCAFIFSATAQVKDYDYEAVYTYNFTKYIDWPIEKGNNIVIGVVGDNNALSGFKKMAKAKSSSNRKFIVKQLTSSEQVAGCNIIFIAKSHEEEFRNVIKEAFGKPILLITEQSQYAKRGSSINFITVGGKLRFEINQSYIQKSGLRVSGSLMQLAVSTN
jgi:hypothetical protein